MYRQTFTDLLADDKLAMGEELAVQRALVVETVAFLERVEGALVQQ